MNSSESIKTQKTRGRPRVRRIRKSARPEGIDPWTANDWYDGIPEDANYASSTKIALNVPPKRKLTLEEYRRRSHENRRDESPSRIVTSNYATSNKIVSDVPPKRKLTLEEYRKRRIENKRDQSASRGPHKFPINSNPATDPHYAKGINMVNILPDANSHGRSRFHAGDEHAQHNSLSAVRMEACEVKKNGHSSNLHHHDAELNKRARYARKGCQNGIRYNVESNPPRHPVDQSSCIYHGHWHKTYFDVAYNSQQCYQPSYQSRSPPELSRHAPKLASSDTHIDHTDANQRISADPLRHVSPSSSRSFNQDFHSRFSKRRHADAFASDRPDYNNVKRRCVYH